MGILGGDSGADEAESLASKALGDSVTAERLTKTSAGILQKDFLEENPVIAYLNSDEQPQFFLYNDTKGIGRNGSTAGGGNDTSYRSLCIVTDSRILFFAAGSKGEALPIGAVSGVDLSVGRMKHRITLNTEDREYTFYINNSIDGDEVKSCGKYIETLAQEISQDFDADCTEILDGLSPLWANEIDGGPSADEALSADPQGDYVNRARYEKIKGVLDPEEKVHFITRGTTVDVEGSSAGKSLFGDDRSRKSGTRGFVRSVITDKRVAIKIPQFLGTDERSVPYNSITSVDLDTGLVNKRLTLQTPGQTYHIEAQEPGKDEVRKAVRFIRNKVDEANQPQVIHQQEDSEPDPIDQIQKLKELNEAGAISDDEFESKKRDLLDKI